MWMIDEMIPQIPITQNTRPNQPWKGAILSISSLAFGFFETIKEGTAKIPKTISKIAYNMTISFFCY